jgi:hypothetical protein
VGVLAEQWCFRTKPVAVRPVYRLLLAALLLSSIALQLSPSAVGVLAFAVCAGFASLVSPTLGLSSWLIAMPVAALVGESIGGTLLLTVTGLVAGVALGLLLRPESEAHGGILIQAERSLPVTLVLVLGLWAIGSTLVNGFGAGIFSALSTALWMIAFVVVASTSRGDGERSAVVIAVVVSATAAGAFAMREYAFGASRLTAGDSVRPLANHVGLAIVLLVAGLLSHRPATARRVKSALLPSVVAIGGFSIILVLTASRGVAFAVGLAGLAMLVTAMVTSAAAAKIVVRIGGAVSVAGAVVVGWLVTFAGQDFLNYIVARFSVNVFDSSDNPRLKIWNAALSQMEGMDWLLGRGLGAFRGLTQRSGLDYYAHSVFVDILVSVGIPGLILVLSLLSYLAIRAFVRRDPQGVGIVAYIAVSFSAYGAMGQTFFWSYSALAVIACTGAGLTGAPGASGGERLPLAVNRTDAVQPG